MCLSEASPLPTREYLARLLGNARKLVDEDPGSALLAVLAALAAAASRVDAGMHEAAWSILSGRLEARHVEAIVRHYPRLSSIVLEAVLNPEKGRVATLIDAVVRELGLEGF